MIAAVAALYSSVGHGGASGYIAVLGFTALSGVAVSSTALTMNLLVAGIALFAYSRQGHFQWRIVWPFLITSIPAAFVGGRFRLEEATYFLVLAAVLLFAAIRLVMRKKSATEERQIPLVPALVFGVVIGLLSGVVGVGGGIFLSPLIILLGWAGAKETAAASALFILVNSGAGILGRLSTDQYEPSVFLPHLLVAGLVGALLGATIGAKKLKPLTVQRVLAAVLFIASMKMVYQYGFAV